MEDEKNQQNKENGEELHPVIETYQSDLSRAMNTTDAKVVQELLATAREREEITKDEEVKTRQRGWYISASLILILFALGTAAYGIYHYLHLTVPVTKTLSVGVFPSTDPIVSDETTIKDAVTKLKTTTNLPEQKPYLVPIVTDKQTLTLLSPTQFFSFLEAAPSEPFVKSMDDVRLGVVNMGDTVETFVIASTPDVETATKEFLIAEPNIVRMFYRAVGIDITKHINEIGQSFQSGYLYNIPVRTLSYTDPSDGKEHLLILYGYATDHIAVLTTKPEVLKMVYDAIISQK